MLRSQIVALIELAAGSDQPFEILEEEISRVSIAAIGDSLLHCGLIPERYNHDSTEEKLWAKYCDILLSRAFNDLGIRSEVIRIRGDSADIRGATADYSIVADAKAFRLSRTAKNQKDFKIAALDDWRRADTYACLVAPWFQYPSRASQIYFQAEHRNVTLLSYVHVKFLLDHWSSQSLKPLWTSAGRISPSKDARRYWEAIDDAVVAITQKSYKELRRYKKLESNAIMTVGLEGIQWWESVKDSYQSLSREEAIARLVRADKIDRKIEFIRKLIDKLS